MWHKHSFLYNSFQRRISKNITRLVRKTSLGTTDPSFNAKVDCNILSALEELCFCYSIESILTPNDMSYCMANCCIITFIWDFPQ